VKTKKAEARLLEKCLKLCKGSYQRALVLGTQCWSGADLQGKAAKYGRLYARSRERLYSRLYGNGFAHIQIGEKGRLELKFGLGPKDMEEVRCSCGVAFKKVKPEPTALEVLVTALETKELVS
jgi:hypothetical protein